MRVFVTGGTGFVGSHAVEALLAANHEVIALVRPTSNTSHLEELGVTLATGHLGDAAGFRDALEGADAVVHIAGLVAAAKPDLMYQANAVGTRDLVDVAADTCPGVPFLYVSSVAAQGPSEGPHPRDADEPPAPVSHYGHTKLEGEGAVLGHRDRLQVMILRPPPVYGPRDTDIFQVFALARRGLAPILGGGDRYLSIVHAQDLADAIVACIEAPRTGAIYPIDDGHVYTWTDLGQTIADAMGRSARTLCVPPFAFRTAAVASELFGKLRGKPPTFDRDKFLEMNQRSWVCGNRALLEHTSWCPQFDLAAGAAHTAKWYEDEGWF